MSLNLFRLKANSKRKICRESYKARFVGHGYLRSQIVPDSESSSPHNTYHYTQLQAFKDLKPETFRVMHNQISMRLLTPKINAPLIVGLTLLLICGLFTSTTLAVPIASLSTKFADSSSLNIRGARLGGATRLGSVPRALAKRSVLGSVVGVIIALLIVAGLIGGGVWFYKRWQQRRAQQSGQQSAGTYR
jgi:hypothetical protein